MYNNNMTDKNKQPFNLSNNTFDDAWNSDYYRNLRKEFLNGKKPSEQLYWLLFLALIFTYLTERLKLE